MSGSDVFCQVLFCSFVSAMHPCVKIKGPSAIPDKMVWLSRDGCVCAQKGVLTAGDMTDDVPASICSVLWHGHVEAGGGGFCPPLHPPPPREPCRTAMHSLHE